MISRYQNRSISSIGARPDWKTLVQAEPQKSAPKEKMTLRRRKGRVTLGQKQSVFQPKFSDFPELQEMAPLVAISEGLLFVAQECRAGCVLQLCRRHALKQGGQSLLGLRKLCNKYLGFLLLKK